MVTKTVKGWWPVMPGVFFGGTYEQYQKWLREIECAATPRPDRGQQAVEDWQRATREDETEQTGPPAEAA